MLDSHIFDKLGGLVSTIGSRQFGASFYETLRETIDFEECTVFSFSELAKFQQVLVECDNEEALSVARDLAQDYISGGYLSDPNVQRLGGYSDVEIYVVHRDAIENEDYRRRYYDRPAVSSELVMFGGVDGTCYFTSLYRRQGATGFGVEEVDCARALVGFVIRALHRHTEIVSSSGSPALKFVPIGGDDLGELRERTLEHLKKVLLGGPHGLSPREAEICAGIVMGYSTLAISLNCSISPNTVATHRKRAYAKLEISSQNELFGRYFNTVRSFQSEQA